MVVGSEISIEEKRAELEAVLHSKELGRSPALARLLEYLCEKTFAGRLHEIKEFSIATEVFGRTEDFSEKRDSLVRVEAHRLRKKLQNYYEGEGASRSVRIVIRPGSYQPEFDRLSTSSPAASPPKSAVPFALVTTGGRNAARWLAATALIGAVLLVVTQNRTTKTLASIPLATVSVAGGPPAYANLPPTVRILAGSSAGRMIDRFGSDWGEDRYFSGGYGNFLKFGNQDRSVRRPMILGAPDQTPFRTFRSGEFFYLIPLAHANYEMRLYFSEVVFGISDSGEGGENQRLFDVAINGTTVLQFHDIYSDAGGPDTADVHVFENVVPGPDGMLRLDFRALREPAWLNAIELIPNATGRALPVRIVAQNTNYTDSHGNLWESDRSFIGGRATSGGTTVSGMADSDLFAGVRYGHFSYRLPSPPGKYTLRLYFAETFFGPGNRGKGGVGSRIFNVYCSGTEILRNFDIFKEVGENRRLQKVFQGISPNPAGRIDLTFEPVVNYAVIYAIELIPEQGP